MKTGVNYNNLHYTLIQDGLTSVKFLSDYQKSIQSTYNKFTPYIEAGNPNISVATAIAAIFNEKLFSFFGTSESIKLGCSLQFNSIVLTFQDKNFADKAMKKFSGLQKLFENFDAIQTTFNNNHFITIPGAYTGYFMTNILGFNKRAYKKLSRDVATLQRAEQEGNLSIIPTADRIEKPSFDQVRKNTMGWFEKKYCSISPGEALPIGILIEVFNKRFNKKKYTSLAVQLVPVDQWVPMDLNTEYKLFSFVHRKGEFNPDKDGYLTLSQSAILLFNALSSNELEEKVENKYVTVNQLLLESIIRFLDLTEGKLQNLKTTPFNLKQVRNLLIERKKNIESLVNISHCIKIPESQKQNLEAFLEGLYDTNITIGSAFDSNTKQHMLFSNSRYISVPDQALSKECVTGRMEDDSSISTLSNSENKRSVSSNSSYSGSSEEKSFVSNLETAQEKPLKEIPF
ncbi:MAG: hypothetical protein K0R98_279 [Rickettsiaceae bacterium]|jgi:hypothetical protein|nr:hypothetical protein [Rickettsiaceae bacterium]